MFYAKRRNDTIFFVGLATKKTRLNLKRKMGMVINAQLWCTNDWGRPKAVQVICVLLDQIFGCQRQRAEDSFLAMGLTG